MGGRDPRPSSERDSLDRVFDALGHRHRRRILLGLLERSPLDVDQLLPPEGEGDREQLAVEFRHTHLPKLDDDGFVEWNGGSRVGRGEAFEEVASVIELFDDRGSQLSGEWP